ncbi:FAD-dependent oxidoreductase [Sulfurovum sp.]|uniref:FAD-dependent oxidoreductase n=1 Tax=Sulfurovum sp. TaxID=1969726 RepID=UPI0025E67007|nr:FAD-dependent oxidoreductase [Sulfurovum sp.]
MSKNKAKIAIVGGGIAGSTAALLLSRTDAEITLFEKTPSLVSGPPFCHLHAGGNLYPEISDEQCLTLLKQSIDFARLYPYGVDHRPTVIALPEYCSRRTGHLLPRLQKLQAHYETLIEDDVKNKVLGDPSVYFKLYDRAQIETLRNKEIVAIPKTLDEWMIPFAKETDLDKIQFPVILVQEYGLNLFRIGARLMLSLDAHPSVDLRLSTSVTKIEKNDDQWILHSNTHNTEQTENFDYLINAAGYQTGKIDDMIGVSCQRMVEFKAAYVSQWENEATHLWPEIIFQGERGTPRGMGQFTPYPQGYFQLHGMTKDITLYEGGLVASTALSCQPKLPQNFIEKIEDSWRWEETVERTKKAIEHLARFIPSFATAKVGSKPLFGAQQIPGTDPTLRVAEVAFALPRYARCEIVKVSSTIDMSHAILDDLVKLGLIEASAHNTVAFETMQQTREENITKQAEVLCQMREYPKALAHRCVPEASN